MEREEDMSSNVSSSTTSNDQQLTSGGSERGRKYQGCIQVSDQRSWNNWQCLYKKKKVKYLLCLRTRKLLNYYLSGNGYVCLWEYLVSSDKKETMIKMIIGMPCFQPTVNHKDLKKYIYTEHGVGFFLHYVISHNNTEQQLLTQDLQNSHC